MTTPIPSSPPRRRISFSQRLWGIVVGLIAGFVLFFFLESVITDLVERSIRLQEGNQTAFIVLIVFVILSGLIGFVLASQDNQPELENKTIAADKKDDNQKATMPVTSDNLISNTLRTIRGLWYLIIDTIRLMLPSTVFTTKRSDDTYSDAMKRQFIELVEKHTTLEERDKGVILDNWIEQISWTNNRANRERDANELITWWQIILAALIPFFANLTVENGGINGPLVVSTFGIFVTVLTGLSRFRRPDERWKHYRRLTEDYQRELWSFIALYGDKYKDHRDKEYPHQAAYEVFSQSMNALRERDINTFFNEVVSKPLTEAEIQQMIADFNSRSSGGNTSDSNNNKK